MPACSTAAPGEEAAQTFARAWREAYTGSPIKVRAQELQVGPMVGTSWAAERGVFDALSDWARTNPHADQLTIRRVADQARVQLRHVAAWCLPARHGRPSQRCSEQGDAMRCRACMDNSGPWCLCALCGACIDAGAQHKSPCHDVEPLRAELECARGTRITVAMPWDDSWSGPTPTSYRDVLSRGGPPRRSMGIEQGVPMLRQVPHAVQS